MTKDEIVEFTKREMDIELLTWQTEFLVHVLNGGRMELVRSRSIGLRTVEKVATKLLDQKYGTPTGVELRNQLIEEAKIEVESWTDAIRAAHLAADEQASQEAEAIMIGARNGS